MFDFLRLDDPVVGYYFSVSFSSVYGYNDARFKEVSGFSMSLEMDTLHPGGESGGELLLPTKSTFGDLTLKRGVLSLPSGLRDWCYSWLMADYSQPLTKKDVYLSLLNSYGLPSMVWQFVDAFPIKLELSAFDAMATGDSAIVVETIVLRYSRISRFF